MYNVLIADDNRQIVSILSEYCKKNNFNVFFAYDGEETLNKIKNEKFDIIFMDPPYQDNVTKKVLKAIDKANILAEDGLIICEHHLLEDLEDNIASFRKTDERKYNKKILTFYTK